MVLVLYITTGGTKWAFTEVSTVNEFSGGQEPMNPLDEESESMGITQAKATKDRPINRGDGLNFVRVTDVFV